MRKLSVDDIKIMSVFSKLTYVFPTDCFTVGKTIVFITPPGSAAKAIGKQGKNVQFLKNKLNQDIKIVESASDVINLCKNYLFPLIPKTLEKDIENKNIIKIEFKTSRERRFLLDNQQKGLKELKEVVNRYFKEIEDIRIL